MFGFNGYENDNEVKGKGNSVNFGARIHDPRIGRFLSVDPRVKDFPYWSPYLFAANNPIYFIDLNGEGPGKVTGPFSNKVKNTSDIVSQIRTDYENKKWKDESNSSSDD